MTVDKPLSEQIKDPEAMLLLALRACVNMIRDYESFTHAKGKEREKWDRIRKTVTGGLPSKSSARKALKLLGRHPYADCLEVYLSSDDISLIERVRQEVAR